MLLEEIGADAAAVEQVPESPARVPGPSRAHYTSHMHGERTLVDVFSRVPDFAFRSLPLGRMELLSMHCGTVSIRRDAGDVRTRSNRMMTFIHQVRGRSAFRHYGHEIMLEAGDFTLCNNSTPYDLRLEGPNDLIMVRVPGAMIQDNFPSPDMLCGRRLARHEGLASMAAAMARDLAAREPGQLPPEAAERAGRHLLDVLTSAYRPLFEDQNAGSAVMSTRFWNVRLFIEDHLRDPALSPSFIARRMRLSDRYLRMIFAINDESPSAYILRRRLEECAAQLRDPRWRQHSITSIAFSWGFNSAPHFARRFRAHFFCSPRDYRQRQLS